MMDRGIIDGSWYGGGMEAGTCGGKCVGGKCNYPPKELQRARFARIIL